MRNIIDRLFMPVGLLENGYALVARLVVVARPTPNRCESL